MHLAAYVPGDGDSAGWGGGQGAGSVVGFASFARLARTAERGLFDFLLLGEGPRLPEPVTVLNALAAVTERIGLAATVDATSGEPYELARGSATLDHLSGGRAGLHVMASDAALTGDNLRRGRFLDRAERYPRAAELVQVARELWDSWTPDGVSRPFAHRGRHFDIAGEFGVPRAPQGHPVVIQSGGLGDLEGLGETWDFASVSVSASASGADVVLSRHLSLDSGRVFYADVKGRLAQYGRAPGALKIMPEVTFVLGGTHAEARERAVEVRRRRVSPEYAILALERIWGTDLSSYDPDGPLPDFDPVPEGGSDLARRQVAERWRALSRAKGLSIRQTVVEASGRPSLVGTPGSVAGTLDTLVREKAADGFVLVPYPAADGLDEFVDRVVPLLQERGAFRTEYEGATLRSHLGLGEPVWTG
ncbi:NtaA/DmoA family FMN-dependent monooxygenase [Streptomyces geranii]|uniref:NtaA/DmoA family FMN-dependent monooxygenase n=1 Tax=Streptomyces geranii TaxID=2058923 RepID=UPI000D03FA6E|nr:NtaA/DmoA family FMN-dependent monooxygenase [Streptomyces geranii]